MEILIIDDEKVSMQLLERLVTRMGIPAKVIWKRNGVEGMDYLDQANQKGSGFPKVIILDLNMPLLDGWSFLDIYSQNSDFEKQNSTVYILTSSISGYDKARAKKYEVVADFISKPLGLDEVRVILQKNNLS